MDIKAIHAQVIPKVSNVVEELGMNNFLEKMATEAFSLESYTVYDLLLHFPTILNKKKDGEVFFNELVKKYFLLFGYVSYSGKNDIESDVKIVKQRTTNIRNCVKAYAESWNKQKKGNVKEISPEAVRKAHKMAYNKFIEKPLHPISEIGQINFCKTEGKDTLIIFANNLYNNIIFGND